MYVSLVQCYNNVNETLVEKLRVNEVIIDDMLCQLPFLEGTMGAMLAPTDNSKQLDAKRNVLIRLQVVNFWMGGGCFVLRQSISSEGHICPATVIFTQQISFIRRNEKHLSDAGTQNLVRMQLDHQTTRNCCWGDATAN